MMTATFIGSLIVFLLAAAGLALGQWFGRAPIEGRCRPRSDNACGRPDCCRAGLDERVR